MTSRRLSILSQDTLHTQYQIILALPLIFWILSKIFLNHQSQDFYGDLFSYFIAFVALVGSSLSFYRANEWGGVKSSLGLCLTFFGLGLLMWFFGQSALIAESFLPLPLNLYDFFFIFIDPCYLVAIIFLAKSLGVIKEIQKNVFLILIPISIILVNLWFVSYLKNENINLLLSILSIEVLFIIGSVLVSSFLLTVYILSFKSLGGKFKTAVLMVFFGLICQYFGDNLYEIFSTMFQNGSLSDFLFYLSIYLITCGVMTLTPKALKYDL